MGKAVVIYVIGLSTIIAYGLWNISGTSLSTVDSYFTYYGRTMAHTIATAAANVGVNQEFNGTFTNVSNRQWFGGEYDVWRTTNVGSTQVVAVARYPVPRTFQYPSGYVVDTVVVRLRKIPFAQYGRFTETEENVIWWGSGDRMHTNRRYWLAGNAPYFSQPISAAEPWIPWGGWSPLPVWAGGYIQGLRVPRSVSSLSIIADTAAFTGSLFVGNDVSLVFLASGDVTVRFPATTGAIRNETIPLTTLAPRGVVAVKRGDFRVEGIYQGVVTLGALSDGMPGKGSIWIVGNGVRAADDPRFNILSPDILGLVAEDNILIETAGRPTGSTVYLQAATYAQNGTIGVENLWGVPVLGTVYPFGNEVANYGSAFLTFDNAHGFNGWWIRDSRLVTNPPPLFPTSTKYELVSWWEAERPPFQ